MQTQEVAETSHDTETSFPEDWHISSRNNFISYICCHSLSKFLRLSNSYLYELVTTLFLQLFKEEVSIQVTDTVTDNLAYLLRDRRNSK